MTPLHRNLLIAAVWQAAVLVWLSWKWLGISPETMVKIVNVGFYLMMAGASALMWWLAVTGPHAGH
jgi:hypothetical protein